MNDSSNLPNKMAIVVLIRPCTEDFLF